jgi:dihydrofolate reductase
MITLDATDVVCLAAISRDGFVGDASGSQAWAGAYFVPELGFHDFIAQVRSIIVGGTTLAALVRHGRWPYGALPGIAHTPSPAPIPDAPLTAIDGPPAQLLAAARRAAAGPVWIVGDVALALAFIDAGLLTRMDLFTMPVTLGEGTDRVPLETLKTFVPVDKHRYPNDVEHHAFKLRASKD